MKKFKFSNKNRKYTLILLILGICITGVLLIYLANQTIQTSQDVEATTTTYKKWDEITLEFTGSHANLSQNSSSPNPFLDYRLSVVFTNGEKTYTVPGYFVGDGLGGSGSKWRAHFTADRDGIWTYTATLTSGSNVAVNGGGSRIDITPSNGSFQVSGESNAGGLYSSCGRLQYVEKHYLECSKTGKSWVKGGTNSPENFLAGADTGQEANIKTVIDYLGSQEVNSIYFLPNNIGGDGKGDTHPFAFNFTSVGAVTYDNLTHYNVARMSKWNEIFNYALKKGISLEFVLNETESENRELLGTTLTTQRKLFYRELVARYSHLPAVRWIIIEENTFSNEQLKSFAGYIKETDPYKHPIAVHTPVDYLDFYQGLVGNPSFDSASIQFYTKSNSSDNASSFTETWRQKSSTANRPWVIDLDEAILKEDSRFGMTKENMDDLRRRVLYPGYFSGGNISWYYGYEQDLGISLWKFQEREPMWKWMSSARRLLSEFPAIANFKPGDDLIISQRHGGGKTQVYYDTGKTFLVYMGKTVNGENATINLSSANGKQLTMQWFNPRTGLYHGSPANITPSSNFIIGASPQAGSGDREDWVVAFKSQDSSNPTENRAYFENNGLIVIQPETKPMGPGWVAGTTVGGYTGPGYIKYDGPDYFVAPGNSTMEYKINITKPGRYLIKLRSNKKNPNASEENDVWLKVDDGTWYKTYNGHPSSNQWVWNTQYEIVHHENIPEAYADLTTGIHSLYLSGRSKGFYIDRIHLYLPNIVNDPLNLDHPESEYREMTTSPLSCNSTCSTNTQCSNTNPNWFCSQQYTLGTWIDNSLSIASIQYIENGVTKTDSGTNYGLNQYIDNGTRKQHLIKSNKIFYRTETPGVGWSSWTNVTPNVSNVGCDLYNDCGGNIVGFNSYIKPDGKTEQHLLRRNTTSYKIFSRNNDNGWSLWEDVTSHTSSVGSGLMTNFTSYVHSDGYILQSIVRGGVLWERTNLGGWQPWSINEDLSSCAGTGTNKCGNGTLISIERSILSDGTDVLHLFRENNKHYARLASPADKRCRLKTNPVSTSCSPAPTTTPTPTATATPTPTPTPTNTPTNTSVPGDTTPPPTALTCTKTHTLANNAILNSNVVYKIKLNNGALSPDGTVIVRDDYDDDLEIVEKPAWCTAKTSAVQSAVLGISDTYSERGSVLVSILFFSLLAGGATYLIVLRNKEVIGWKLIKEKPYLAGILATGAVLVVGSIYFLITQEDVSPTDTPALSTEKYLECNVPAGTDTITYTMKIKGTVGSTINNTAEVKTGTSPSVKTCSTSFVIKSAGDTATPTPTKDPSVTPSVTPTMTNTPVPTPTKEEPPITTEPPVGFICGPADTNGNGYFDIIDFGGRYVGFASNYQKTCDDTEEMRQTYSPCGGKDVVPDQYGNFGKIDILDFQSFAQRYNSKICDL